MHIEDGTGNPGELVSRKEELQAGISRHEGDVLFHIGDGNKLG